MSAEQQAEFIIACLPGYSKLLTMHVTHGNSIYLRYRGISQILHVGMVASYVHLRIKIDDWIKMQYISRSSSALNSW